jgi:hypothetical protein
VDPPTLLLPHTEGSIIVPNVAFETRGAGIQGPLRHPPHGETAGRTNSG